MNQHRCQAKIGQPYHMHECGQPIEYRTAEQARAAGDIYSGWYHQDRNIMDHGAVQGIYARSPMNLSHL